MLSQVFLFSRARKSLGLATLSASQPGSWNQPPPPQQRPSPPQQPLLTLAQPPAPIPHSRKSENITCTDWLPKEGAGDAYAFKNTPVRDIYGGKEFLERLFTVKEIWFEILAQYHLHWLSVLKLQQSDRTCLKVGFDKKIWSHKSHLSNGQPLLRKRGARLLCICCCVCILYFLYFQGTNFPRQKEAWDWVSHWVSASRP